MERKSVKIDTDAEDQQQTKEGFLDGQLSFKIRKTKNQDVMR